MKKLLQSVGGLFKDLLFDFAYSPFTDFVDDFDQAYSNIRGHGFKTFMVLVKCFARSGFNLDKLHQQCFLAAHELRGYKSLPSRAVLSTSQYETRHDDRVKQLLWRIKQTQFGGGLPLTDWREYYGIPEGQDPKPYDESELYSPDADDIDKLLSLERYLEAIEKDLKVMYRRAHGKLSVARSSSLVLDLVQVSHAGVSVVKFGMAPVCVIPWEAIQHIKQDGADGEYSLRTAVNSFLLTNGRFKNIVRQIEKKTGVPFEVLAR